VSDTVCVPRVVYYNDDEPLGVDGEVVGIIKTSNRRITVLVREPASNHVRQDGSETSEGVALPDDYRELQEVAKQAGIKANQSAEELREALRDE
jgi:hypothetical protein